MCEVAGIGGYKTNHSLRATDATRLYSSGIDEQLVMERTGHRSTEGVRSYKRTSNKQQEAVSDTLRKLQTILFWFNSSQISSNMPTNISTATADHTGAFHFSSSSNITINFNNN